MREFDTVKALYESLVAARRVPGQTAVPFDRFAAPVNEQVKRLQQEGNPEVAFQVAVKDGRVNVRRAE